MSRFRANSISKKYSKKNNVAFSFDIFDYTVREKKN